MLHKFDKEYHAATCDTERYAALTKLRQERYEAAKRDNPEGVAAYEAYAESRRKRS